MSSKKQTKAPAIHTSATSSLTGEYGNICLLLILYTLQGIPMGLGRAIPMILIDRGCTYSELGIFSLQSWPFSLKLLWAPAVDCLYIRRFGRRKTWLIPAQVMIGLVMLWSSTHVDALLYGEKTAVWPLTIMFISMNFLCATQDIAVDGWALTMLRKENTSYQAICNAAGQTFGFTLGWTGLTVLEHLQIMDLSGFLFYLGIIFLLATLAVAVLKSEKSLRKGDKPTSIIKTYASVWSIAKLPPIQTLIIILFTWKLGFAVVDGVAPIKFQELGVPKEHITYMSSLLMPLEIALPVFASPWASGPMPFNLAVWMYPFKVAIVPITAMLVYATPSMDPFPWGFWAAMVVVAVVKSITTEWMFVSQISLFARVSDPAIGGTYMSFLNTVGNLGNKLPPTLTFFLVDYLTCRESSCSFQADGFYVMTLACTIVGTAWYALARGPVRHMQLQDPAAWKVGSAKIE